MEPTNQQYNTDHYYKINDNKSLSKKPTNEEHVANQNGNYKQKMDNILDRLKERMGKK